MENDNNYIDQVIEIFNKLQKIKGAKSALRDIYNNPDSHNWPDCVRNAIEHKLEEVSKNYLDGIEEIDFDELLQNLQKVKNKLNKYPKNPEIKL
jgi:hypothetical protein